MKPNIENTDETQTLDNPAERHAISPSDVLFAFLTEGEISVDDLRLLAQIYAEPYTLVAFKPTSQRGLGALQGISDLAKSIYNHPTEAKLESTLVMLFSNEDALRFAQIVKEKGLANKIVMAISLPFASLNAIPLQYELLACCLSSANEAGIVEAKNNAFTFLTTKIKSTLNTESLLHPAIATLARYDQMNQSNLLETLQVYLENDRNAQHSANLLYLHRNSLQYRVHRIQDIAGIDLDDPEERAYLRLSFMLCNR